MPHHTICGTLPPVTVAALQVATQVVASLLALESIDPEEDITIYINSQGELPVWGLARWASSPCWGWQGGFRPLLISSVTVWRFVISAGALDWPPLCVACHSS